MTEEFTFPNKDYTHVLYTSLKNEGPYVLDWICYHLKIGFTHFAIATNDCEDGTDNLLRQLEEIGIVTHRNNPGPHPQGILKHAFLRLQELEAIEQAEWLMHLDIDEYLRIDIGQGELADLHAAIGEMAQAVSFNTQVFGNAEVSEFLDAPVISQFKYASHPLQAVPLPLRAIKTFYKNGYFEKLSANRPLSPRDDVDFASFDWLDADGVSSKKITKSQFTHSNPNGYVFGTALGRVNRYGIQSLDAFANKWQRGFAQGVLSTDRGELSAPDYWLRNNWNIVKNKKIQSHLPKVEKIKDQLIDNEKIKKLHRKAFRTHRQWANQLRRNHYEFFDDFEHLEALPFCCEFPLLIEEETVPLLKDWFINTTQLRQKILATKLLKFYIQTIDYGPKATELPK